MSIFSLPFSPYIKQSEYGCKALSNLITVETIAQEIKINSKWEYKLEVGYTTKLAEVKKDSKISEYLKDAIDYHQKVISNLKTNKIDDARFNYYIAQMVESSIKNVENTNKWQEIIDIFKKM